MILTVQFLKTKFIEFNKEYFNNTLPTPTFKITNNKSTQGTCRIIKPWVIKISSFYDKDEKGFCTVLLHEMIHLKIAISEIRDSSSHGYVFKRYMREINIKGGWDIDVMDNCRPYKISKKNAEEEHLICAIQMNDGRYFMVNVSQTESSINNINSLLKRWYKVTSWKWLHSTHERFHHLPKVRSKMRGHYIDEKEYNNILTKSKEVTFNNYYSI